jgi:hypothetical protein
VFRSGWELISRSFALQDWAALHEQHGLASFLAMRVGEAGDSVGVLTLASLRPAAFMELW